MSLRRIGLLLTLLLLAVAALALGLGFPIHFRAVSPLLLQEAAAGTPTLADRADEFLTSGRPGPVALMAQAQPAIGRDAWRQERRAELLENHPLYRFSGGPAPYFEQFLARIDLPETRSSAPVLPLVLPADHRAVLRDFLRTSSNATVQALLASRELSGYQRFLPVFSAAGHPLEAAILVTALLEQSTAWQPGVARPLREIARAAPEDPAALARLERVYLAVVALASRTDWTQLTVLLERVPDLEHLEKLAAATHAEEGDFATLYSAILLSGDAPGILGYLEEEPENGWEVMAYALDLGAGALTTMTTFDKPLYDPPQLVERLPLQPLQDALKGFTEQNPRLALYLKLAALFVCGYCLALIVARLLHPLLASEAEAPGGGGWVRGLHALFALAVAALIWVLAEPRLLEFAPNAATDLRLNLAQILPQSNLSATAPSSAMIDQVTLIVLLMFLVIQLAVFVFSVLKIKEIKAQTVDPSVKIELLENEDVLFDMGLYVGLGGTVGSLILVVMELVEASLMAAYASTLFGIIFVAVLKIFFLRPYRRRLILEASA